MERQTTRRGMTRQDQALPMEERQGHNALQSETGPCIATRPDLKRLIITDPMQTHNPDTDRLGSGHFCIQHPAQDSTLCTIHVPSGHTAGSLPLDRVQLLYRAFTAQEQSADSTFEAAVAQLLIRSRPARAKGARPPVSDCPGAPTEITALHIGLQLQIELFSSPLMFGSGTRSYYSSCTADAAFGANLDCYARVWGGFSYCSPEEDDKDMDKAVRWAIASAQILQQPSLTAFIPPAKPSTAYRRWLDHPLLHTLLDLSLVQASEAQNTAAPRRRSGLGRTVFFVAHESALALIDMVNLHKSLAACSLPVSWQRSTTIMGCSPDTLRQACSHHSQQEFHPPKAFHNVAQLPLILPCPWHGHFSEQQCYTSMTRLPPAWPCAETIIYTDGSAVKKDSVDEGDGQRLNHVGSGVFCRALELNLRVDPYGQGGTNTITRAELVAISSSLDHVQHDDCIIATDSLASMYMIQKQLENPAKTTFSPHSTLLEMIAARLCYRATSGLRTTIIKVKAHTGSAGNERADTLANEARNPALCDTS